jgi:DNA-binding MarR family transcriptional regulator
MKKQSVVKQVLNVLNTQGGKKPKELIDITKAKPASVYNALNRLHKLKMVAKEEDGVYISQTRTSVSEVTNKAKRGRPTRVDTMNTQYVSNLLKENKQMAEWTQMWKQRYDRLEADYTDAKVMYLNSQAVISYLEEKVAQLIRGN